MRYESVFRQFLREDISFTQGASLYTTSSTRLNEGPHGAGCLRGEVRLRFAKAS